MEALEFMREKERMCHSYGAAERCSECPARETNLCNAIDNIERLLPIVEKWSKEHQIVRNIDHVAEGLEKLGFKVDKRYVEGYVCPAPYSITFDVNGVCSRNRNCTECKKWWLEEYHPDINVGNKEKEERQCHECGKVFSDWDNVAYHLVGSSKRYYCRDCFSKKFEGEYPYIPAYYSGFDLQITNELKDTN